MKKTFVLIVATLLISFPMYNFSWKKLSMEWKTMTPANEPEARSENAFARVGDRFFLFGGRKKQSLEIYDTKTNQWTKGAPVPLEMHHFQAIEYKGEVYVLGAFTGDYPHEVPIPRIHIYNPKTDQWREGAEIPAERRRGAAGVTVYKDKIYLICGITDGHWDGHVTWMDEYDPKTDKWRILPDAPQGRDHFQAAIVGDQMLVAGGRRSTAKIGRVLDTTIGEVDVYDFKKGSWSTLPAAQNIPTQRGGCTSVVLDNQVIVIGGESPQKLAHNQTEAFNFKTNSWQSLAPLKTGRHGTQAVVHKNKIYIVAGAANQGGGPEISSMEVME